MNSKIQEIIEFLEEHNIEIVSYGLAPNPNGFCFEMCNDACKDEADALFTMLESLTSDEVKALRDWAFENKG